MFCVCTYKRYARLSPQPTNEEDGEGDEEQEDVGDQVEGVHEAAIVEHALLHAVGVDASVVDASVVAAKRQGHAPDRPLHPSLGSTWGGEHQHNDTMSEHNLRGVLRNLMPCNRLQAVGRRLELCGRGQTSSSAHTQANSDPHTPKHNCRPKVRRESYFSGHARLIGACSITVTWCM